MNKYFGSIIPGTPRNEEEYGSLKGLITARFVGYDDCQQLILWLPEYGRDAYRNLWIREKNSSDLWLDVEVNDILSGSVQLLLDTSTIPPGFYELGIEHKSGGIHRIDFQKVDVLLTEKPISYAEVSENKESSPIVYRDGFGNVLPDADLIQREISFKEIENKFKRKLEYAGNFRSGTITYIEGDIRLPFYHEMGGGKCAFYIEIPSAEEWVAKTLLPANRRLEILKFLAETVQRQEAPSWNFEIREKEIVFLY